MARIVKKVVEKLKSGKKKAPAYPKVLTAEGWKRLMMKKSKKTS